MLLGVHETRVRLIWGSGSSGRRENCNRVTRSFTEHPRCRACLVSCWCLVLRNTRAVCCCVCCLCCVRSWAWAWVWARAGGHGRARACARTCESHAYLRGLFSCSTEEGSEDEEEGGEVAEEGSEDAECDEEGELLAPPPLTTAVGTCGDG